MELDLGLRLSLARQTRHYSQQDLARLVGISQKHLSQLEKGRVPFGSLASATLRRLAQTLEVSTDYLLGLTDDQAPRGDAAGGQARLTPGLWKGQVWIAPDFDKTDEDLIRAFEGEEEP